MGRGAGAVTLSAKDADLKEAVTARPGPVVTLPSRDGSLERYRLGMRRTSPSTGGPIRSRMAYAAAHVVTDPLRAEFGGSPTMLDWDATLAFRRHLWCQGLGVAEAMDTAQRGDGLGWDLARELIERSAGEASQHGGHLVAGAGTDQLDDARPCGIPEVIRAYRQQVDAVRSAGAGVVLLASRQLAAVAEGPQDYRKVYGEVLASLDEPAILHWLGPMFDAALGGYWGTTSLGAAMDVLIHVVESAAEKVSGIKFSLLDPGLESSLRERLPPGVRVFTGDDYNYVELIAGDGRHHSDALLGVFDPIAEKAGEALRALDEGRPEQFRASLEPTVPLARALFAPPTSHYKTGVVFLAYINGYQEHFRMIGGMESARSALHLAELVRLADQAGIIVDVELAARRVATVMTLAGVPAAE